MPKALYFMPDISGFTNFVNTTEVEHSIHIIAELLELLIDNNTIDLQLVEVEGDALFMYTTTIPTYQQLINQVKVMLESFHRLTKEYETKRICDCGSCKTTIDLDLKFLVHYGELSMIKVKNIIKPYGKEVIEIHQLLKNQIPVNEYVLFTTNTVVLFQNEMGAKWLKNSQEEATNELTYSYKILDKIKVNIEKEVEKEAIKNDDITQPDVIINKTFDADIHNIFAYISELKYRHIWDKEIQRIDFDHDKVNRVGTEHNCVLKFGNMKFETIKKPSKDSLIYGERTKEMFFLKKFYYLIKLHKIDKHTTQLTLSLFLEYNILGKIMKKEIVKKVSRMWERKLTNLHKVSKNNLVKIIT
ncbi:hypothetical protein HNP99_003191 [Flavobacterium sp. 28A]|uniref:DUF2652 domain-containing protein n=1 Tax=Flavobacterium sp. 28A TaxID=2735895 RepID=UPI0015701F82|nr:DUF2652 domain-containing protein [Flavobacterium sp. 28A]NRT16817.1 hypothetical protein [Flavobacterium sp. 28A]